MRFSTCSRSADAPSGMSSPNAVGLKSRCGAAARSIPYVSRASWIAANHHVRDHVSWRDAPATSGQPTPNTNTASALRPIDGGHTLRHSPPGQPPEQGRPGAARPQRPRATGPRTTTTRPARAYDRPALPGFCWPCCHPLKATHQATWRRRPDATGAAQKRRRRRQARASPSRLTASTAPLSDDLRLAGRY